MDVVEGANASEMAHHGDRRYSSLLLRFNFSSDINFVQLANDRNYHMGLETKWCGDGDDGRELEAGYPYFYLGPLEVQADAEKDARYADVASGMGGRFVYHAYLPLMQLGFVNSSSPGEPPFPPYDLSSQPRDVCLRVRGGNMAGMHGKSEFVIFSGQVIADALDRYRNFK